jgi:hypothetical protein
MQKLPPFSSHQSIVTTPEELESAWFAPAALVAVTVQ